MKLRLRRPTGTNYNTPSTAGQLVKQQLQRRVEDGG